MTKGLALSDVKIVEWGAEISAPYCAKLMADFGAEVVKIEPPLIGDEARRHGPFPQDIPNSEKSGLFLYLNTNKLGVTLDPTKARGREVLLDLLKGADVFVENQAPRLIKELKLDFASLHAANPRLIVVSVTPFGQTGPYSDWKGYDLNVCALGGITTASGSPGREPLVPPLSQGDLQAGIIGAIATMTALFQRDRSKEGMNIDLSAADCWATFHVGIATQAFLEERRVRERSGHRALHRPYPDEVLPCKDGYVAIDTPQNRQWRRLLEVMGNPSWANDPIFADRIKTTDEYVEKADAYLGSWLMQHTKAEIFKLCQDNQVPAAPIRTVAEVVDDAQFRERGYFVEVDHPVAGKLKYPGTAWKFSETPSAIRRPAPRLGEHNREIYRQRLGYSESIMAKLKQEGII